jgi:HD-GYP domain-containing protein (c-di-GMP phosphodiesterase class II)
VNVLNPQSKELFEELLQFLRDAGFDKYLDFLKTQHTETYDHCFRVAQLSLDLGYDNNLDPTNLRHLGLAGMLHDFGKTKIPDSIMLKPERLDEDEYKIVKGHVRLGLLEINSLEDGVVSEIVATHHEFKMTPYPRSGIDRRLKNRMTIERRQPKEHIKRLGQILAIADIVDALMNNRSYREALPLSEANQILRSDFTGDTQLVDQVLRRLYGNISRTVTAS